MDFQRNLWQSTSVWSVAEEVVLQVIAVGDALGSDVRLAAAVNFKNLVKYRWVST